MPANWGITGWMELDLSVALFCVALGPARLFQQQAYRRPDQDLPRAAPLEGATDRPWDGKTGTGTGMGRNEDALFAVWCQGLGMQKWLVPFHSQLRTTNSQGFCHSDSREKRANRFHGRLEKRATRAETANWWKAVKRAKEWAANCWPNNPISKSNWSAYLLFPQKYLLEANCTN